MLTISPFPTISARHANADVALPVAQASEMERLALAMLQCAERLEIEAGFVARRRQRFVLVQPEALHRLALGVAPA